MAYVVLVLPTHIYILYTSGRDASVDQLKVNLTKGGTVGPSHPASTDVIVPCELVYRIYIVHTGRSCIILYVSGYCA